MRRDWTLPLLRLALAGLTLACLAHVCTCGFVNFDDPRYVSNNPHVQRGLCLSSLRWAWTDFRWSMYAPLTRTSFLLDHELYGLNPHGYHLTNLLIHLVNVLLLFEVLRSMTGAVWRCFLVAACFAIHPLHVESVAWITERKDVLSTLLGLLCLAAWVRWTRTFGVISLLASLALYLLSLLAKPMLVTLPFVLLLLDHWPLRRSARFSWRRLVVEKIPFLVLAVGASIVTATVHHDLGAMECLGRLPLGYRLANAAAACGDYLFQTACPINLAVFYPHPLEQVSMWKVAGSLVLLAAITLLVIVQRHRRPWLLTGWLWFLGTLTPVLGLVAMGGYARADRYTYVPHIGLFLGLVWGLDRVAVRWRHGRMMAAVAASGVLAVWGVLAWNQVLTWRNSNTLWQNALRATSDNFLAHTQLGPALESEGRIDEAARLYQSALRIKPGYPPALLFLGSLYVRQEHFAAAEPYLRAAVASTPADSQLHFLLGVVLEKLNRLPESESNLLEALELEPDAVEAHLELGAVLDRLGRLQEAEEHFQQALRLDGLSARAHANLGIVQERTGRLDQAAEHFRAALRLDPHQAAAHAHLGVFCEWAGELPEAAEHLCRALEANPGDGEVHCNLGVVRERQSRLSDSAQELLEAVRLSPALPNAHVNLGIVLERQGKRAEAIACFREAVRLAPGFVAAHASLASALFAAGHLEAARKEFAEASRLDPQWPVRNKQQAWRLAVHPNAKLRNGPEALRLALQVSRAAQQDDLVGAEVLAAAQAEVGNFQAAVRGAEWAKQLASQGGNGASADRIGRELACYVAGRAYRTTGW